MVVLQVYRRLEDAGQLTGDRVWRMPLWQHYTDKMKKSALADLNNISSSPGRSAGTGTHYGVFLLLQ
jgi:aminopeptidase